MPEPSTGLRLDRPHGEPAGRRKRLEGVLIERMPLAYLHLDADFRIVEWNPAAEKVFGYSKEEILGHGPPYEKLIPAAALQHVDETLARARAGDMSAHSVNENLTKDGRVITCEWFNTPLFDDAGRFEGIVCLAQDITSRVSLEEQLRHSQKMEAVGELAGKVAHDFNNLLTVIVAYGEVLLHTPLPEEETRRLLLEIVRAGERSAALTRQLLTLSRKQVRAPKTLDLGEIIRNSQSMLRRVIGEDVRLVASLEPGLGAVNADPAELEQVLINLVVNARDAMPQGGELTLATRHVELDEADARRTPGVRPGGYVVLTVSDTGIGMTEEIRRRMFEPFFTTKGAGVGTGLGLSVVHGIIRESAGHIAVESEPGQGTTFRIHLPRVESDSHAGNPVPSPSQRG